MNDNDGDEIKGIVMMNDNDGDENKGKAKRSSWEIEEDLRAIQRVRLIMRDKERIAEVKELARAKQDELDANGYIIDGDMQQALGL